LGAICDKPPANYMM